MNYHAYTPMTDTREQPSFQRGVPVEDQFTIEVAWWEPKPVVVRYERGPRFPRLRKALGAVAVIFGCLVLSAVPSTPMDSPAVSVSK